MRPARKPPTPSINAPGLGMLPMGSVGSITITTVEVVAVILLSGQGDLALGTRCRQGSPDRPTATPGQAPTTWKEWFLGAHRIPGNARWKAAPWLGFAVAQSRPRWLSMIDRLIESPMPSPPGFVV